MTPRLSMYDCEYYLFRNIKAVGQFEGRCFSRCIKSAYSTYFFFVELCASIVCAFVGSRVVLEKLFSCLALTFNNFRLAMCLLPSVSATSSFWHGVATIVFTAPFMATTPVFAVTVTYVFLLSGVKKVRRIDAWRVIAGMTTRFWLPSVCQEVRNAMSKVRSKPTIRGPANRTIPVVVSRPSPQPARVWLSFLNFFPKMLFCFRTKLRYNFYIGHEVRS